ncbi:MAG: DUF3285 domain-containing protein [Leptolyngbya sp. BL-A-14]
MEPQSASSEANAPAAAIELEPGISQAETVEATVDSIVGVTEPKPSYVKLAMRNMVRKRGQSLQHFALTTIGLLAVLVGLSYLTR